MRFDIAGKVVLIGEANALGSESRRGPSLLTRASDRASLRNNEV